LRYFRQHDFLTRSRRGRLCVAEEDAQCATPYKTSGYPVCAILFVAVAIWLLINTVRTNPLESLCRAGLISLGLPVYVWQRRTAVRPRRSESPYFAPAMSRASIQVRRVQIGRQDDDFFIGIRRERGAGFGATQILAPLSSHTINCTTGVISRPPVFVT